MSRGKQPTREIILDRALQRFNEVGIEALGMRELARELELSPGNLTYHFPKKEDLIVALAKRLSELNSKTIPAARQPADLREFLEMFRLIFTNQYQYRCLVLSLVHLLEHYPAFAAWYSQVQLIRSGSFVEKLGHLQAAGFLRPELGEADLPRIAAYCSLIGRFWLPNYWVSQRDRPVEEMKDHYLSLLAGVFLPYVTPKGERDLALFLNPGA